VKKKIQLFFMASNTKIKTKCKEFKDDFILFEVHLKTMQWI
jgi:hypothetical protein